MKTIRSLQNCTLLAFIALTLCRPHFATAQILEARFDWSPTLNATNSVSAFTITDFVLIDDQGQGVYNCVWGEPFDVSKIPPDTVAAMNCIFASTDGNNEALWGSVWNDSGKCTGLTIADYFGLLVGIHQNLNLNKALFDSQLGPPFVDAENLVQQFSNTLGVTPSVQCTDTNGLDYVALCVQPKAPFAVWNCENPVPTECTNTELTMPLGQKQVTQECAPYFPYTYKGLLDLTAPIAVAPAPLAVVLPPAATNTINTTGTAPVQSPFQAPLSGGVALDALGRPIATSPMASTNSTTTTTKSSSSSSDVGVIVGAVIGGIAFVALAAALAVYLMRRKKRVHQETKLSDFQGVVVEQQQRPYKTVNAYSLASLPVKDPLIVNGFESVSPMAHSTEDGEIGPEELEAGGKYAAPSTPPAAARNLSSGGDIPTHPVNDFTPSTAGKTAAAGSPFAPTGWKYNGSTGLMERTTPSTATAVNVTGVLLSAVGASAHATGAALSPRSRRSSSDISQDPVISYIRSHMPQEEGSHIVRSTSSGGSRSDLSIWEIKFNDLKIERAIGEGSWGRVYRALWNESEVAVKVLMDNTTKMPQVADSTALEAALSSVDPLVSRLQQEAGLMSSLHHPNVLQFLGMISYPPAVVTEYCSRGSLYEVIRKAVSGDHPDILAALTWKRRIDMALDAVRGMIYLHSRSPPIIHRDLKSPNLLIDVNWKLKVADFNLSRLLLDASPEKSASVSALNPRWLAPEVLSGDKVGRACDVFSFGVVMWELLTFEVPWVSSNGTSMNPWGVVSSILAGKRLSVPDMDRLPNISKGDVRGVEEYIKLMQRCWAKNPDERPDFLQVISELRVIAAL